MEKEREAGWWKSRGPEEARSSDKNRMLALASSNGVSRMRGDSYVQFSGGPDEFYHKQLMMYV